MKELKLGKITSAELAEWFNVSKATLQNKSSQYLEKLDQYCSFRKIYGGIYVDEIYIPKYDKHLNVNMDKMYVDEIAQAQDGLSTISGMARKFQDDLNISERALRNKLSVSRDRLFGVVNRQNELTSSGIIGDRKYVWAIKVNDQNGYRNLTEEEFALFKELMSRKVQDESPENLIQAALLDQIFKETDMTKEQYLAIKESKSYNFYYDVLKRFKELTGGILVCATQHTIQGGIDFTQSNEENVYKMKLLNG